jgi:membrane protein required for colicin V production
MDFALILDIVVVVILLISSVVAVLRGFVREVLTIVGLAGASITALTAGPKLAPGLESWLTSDLGKDAEDAKMWDMIPYDIAAGFLSYAGLFVITLVVLSLISHWIAKSVHAIGLGPVDRSLGVVFGIVRGLVLVGLLYMPFHILMQAKDKDDWFGSSHTFSYVEYTSEFLMAFLPESWNKDTKEDDSEEDLDPLKNLTGEDAKEDTQNSDTDEEKAEEKSSTGYDDIERQAIDVLIQNQDKIKDLIQGVPNE